MRVFVAGATGRVATELIANLKAAGHQVVAGVRKPENVADREVQSTALDLHADTKELKALVADADAVYFVAGSRGKDLLQTDAFGAVKLMQACEATGVRRFVMLSSVFADEPEKWGDPALTEITDYNIAKFFADQWLMNNTHLVYTIVQPGSLVEGPGSGRVNLHVTERSSPNSIANVAAVLAGVLEAKNSYGRIIKTSDGDTEVLEAIAQYR